MNFEFMPELSEKWGYPAVLLLMATATIGIFTWFKKRKMAVKQQAKNHGKWKDEIFCAWL